MSCTFWLRRKKKLAKQREQERQAAMQTAETAPTVEETPTVEEAKPTRKRVSKNADGETNSES